MSHPMTAGQAIFRIFRTSPERGGASMALG